MNDICLNCEITIDKVGRVGLICHNTSNFCRGKENILGFFFLEKFFTAVWSSKSNSCLVFKTRLS